MYYLKYLLLYIKLIYIKNKDFNENIARNVDNIVLITSLNISTLKIYTDFKYLVNIFLLFKNLTYSLTILLGEIYISCLLIIICLTNQSEKGLTRYCLIKT